MDCHSQFVAYLVIDGQGNELATVPAVEVAMYRARSNDQAVAVLSDAGVLLASISRDGSSSNGGERAAQRWRQAHRRRSVA